MKNIILGLAVILISTPVSAAVYHVDKAATDVAFVIDHPVGFSSGFFNDAAGTLEIDEGKVKSIRLDLKTASVDTLNPKRDEVLRSDSLFDAANFPVISFNSTDISNDKVKADLIYKGKAYSVTLDYQYLGQTAGGKEAVVRLFGKIKRADIGMTDADDPSEERIGKEIELFISLRGKQ